MSRNEFKTFFIMPPALLTAILLLNFITISAETAYFTTFDEVSLLYLEQSF